MKFHRITVAAAVAILAVSLLPACSSSPKSDTAGATATDESATVAKAPVPAPVLAPVEKPAPKQPAAGEAALGDGIKAYQAGKYRAAETQLKAAIKAGLDTPADLASAHKHLAFIYCTSKRDSLCAAAFKNAKAADPDFALTKTEAGHPTWGKVYRKALGIK